ncbi:molybdopterin-guanine dinucleotide biosynthesis protein A [Thermacetogenium phaeum DSM 12270]|uniref:Probable molybdenum cofactor guanylyltransferase n=1 Tax=Thermacetogenium phaeum (strain ATCC BAA-254 / DSM 26808 / PB) TaxID=1089553 RepID=K4LBX1_THEPS|nr:molybdenum cofactor guanylyltransferase [Thermacetogenium phaeum]AFV10396.1 molybdopterin-guanine dinucleotide biosynthesis protein A [Thermacetogenium phaeum DSM 12270]
MEASGIILAGGCSSRMGTDKSLMVYERQTLIERTVNELRKVVNEIVIASNNTSKYSIPGVVEVPDLYPGMGPLAGIHAGLKRVKHQYAFVIGCDMPLFKAELAKYLLEICPGYDVVVPQIDGYGEPLCAVYSKGCIEPIENCLKAGLRTVIMFYPQVRVLTVGRDEIERIGNPEELFYNLNTPEDYWSLMMRQNTDGSLEDNRKC